MALILIGFLLSILYMVYTAVYRLYFHPLSKYPGPKLAALSFWYEFYYDAICHGKYTFEIARMHEKYGPIIRITPDDLHVNDPDFYEVLYSRSTPRNKSTPYTRMFGSPLTMFSAVDHDHHRMLRSQMNPFFSMNRIRTLEPAITALVGKLCTRLEKLRNTDTPVTILHAYLCFTTDVITDYTMGEGYHYLDEADFVPAWTEILGAMAKSSVWNKRFPWMLSVMMALPEGFILWMDAKMGLWLQYRRRVRVLIDSIVEAHGGSNPRSKEDDSRTQANTLFHDILNSDLPDEQKTAERLAQEVEIIIGAGADTTAKVLMHITFYLLQDPDLLVRMKEELNELDPQQTATLVQLEQMPYLNAVVMEGIRLSYGVSTRLPRIAPYDTLRYKEWSIPPGTPVSMSCLLIHQNEEIFQDALRFIPERWLNPDTRKNLEKYMVSFTKGSRQCIGMNLAKAEILIAVSKIFRTFDFELFETSIDDVRPAHDPFVIFPRDGSKGVRVLIK